MRFIPTPLRGAWIIDSNTIDDNRGFFARTFCWHEFENQGLRFEIKQCSISHNIHRGTLRGMHYQRHPFAEAKLVRCISGMIYDVFIDLRPDSDTFCGWFAVELKANDSPPKALYIPEGFAHGFQALEDNTTVFYEIFEFFHPEAAMGIRWNDPEFAIPWPISNPIISEKDRSYPDYK